MTASSRPDSTPSDGPRFEQFCHEFIRHTKGRWAKAPLELEGFQREFVNELLEIGPDGRRVYQEALLGIPRKNGKSTLAAALGLYMLAADEEQGPEVYAAAASRDQARVIFNQAREFVDASPRLADFLRPRQYHVECRTNRGVFRVLASDARLQHGLNPSATVIDELHAHRDGELYTAMTSGSGARDEPLTVTITTAGFDQEQILGQIYGRALEVPDIEVRDFLTIARDRENGFLMYWFGAPRDADPDDPAVWRGSNPAPWITQEYLRRERYKPTTRLADFRRLHLNQWVDVESDWLPRGAWANCRSDAELDPKLPVAVGIDLGQVDDSTAVVIAQRQGDRTVVRAKFWMNPNPPGHMNRSQWRTDYTEVADYLRSLRRKFPAPMARIDGRTIDGPAFAYDPWSAEAMAQQLRDEGLAMVRIDQTNPRMVPATTTLYELVVTGRLAHDGDPVLASHIAHVVPVPRGESGWRLTKPPGSSKKIDGAIATVMAVSEAQRPAPKPRMRAFAV